MRSDSYRLSPTTGAAKTGGIFSLPLCLSAFVSEISSALRVPTRVGMLFCDAFLIAHPGEIDKPELLASPEM